MVKVPAWSYSSLDTFVSCPRKYHETRVTKTYKEEETAAQRLGTATHLHFEHRVKFGTPLPEQLAMHEPYVKELEAWTPRKIMTERKVGLTRALEPCGFFDKDVWWRGVLDVHATREDGTHRIADYKTGKEHSNMRQLHLFGIYAFLEGAEIIQAEYYWTQTRTKTRITLPKAQLGMLLEGFVKDLTKYKDAFKINVWPPIPNGLCASYCPVTDCEYHGTRHRG